MAEDWDVFHRRVDGFTAVVFTDLAVAQLPPDPARTILVKIRLTLLEPGADGLGTPAEHARLYDLEDELFAALCASPLRARYVGRVTTQGRRDAYYYAPGDAGVEALAQQVFASFDYSPQLMLVHDAGWQAYHQELAPTEFERRTIENHRLVDLLQQSGDSIEVPRPVEHFAAFSSHAERVQFLTQVEKEGFEELDLNQEEERDPRWPVPVCIVRRDPVSLEWIDALTADLYFRAEACGGRYNGWGCTAASGS